MTNFLVSDKLRSLIEGSELEKEKKERLLAQNEISHQELIAFYRQAQPCSSLLELIRTTKMNIPNKNAKNEDLPKSKEFVEMMEKLRLQAKEDEYQRLINKSKADPFALYEQKEDKDWNPAQASKEVRSHVTTIFNILVSVCSVVYAIWYWTDSSAGMKNSIRVLLCVFAGILVLVAEVVVYMGYLNRIEDARIRERNKKEIKKVVQTIKID